MRAFLGLAVPPVLAHPLLSIQARFRAGRPVPEENLHLTVAFLDEQPEDALMALHEGLEARRLPACAIRPTALSVFGERRPRLLAMDCERGPALVALRDAARSAAREAGIDLPRTRFRPHVTLIRFGELGPDEAARLAAGLERERALPEGAQCSALTLYRSTLAPEGAVYEPLADYPLR